MDLRHRLTELARIESAPTPVVSVYLRTRWADEHERERARIFVKNELRRARESDGLRADPADLAWVEAETDAVINQSHAADAHGVVLFACHGLGLRDALTTRMPVEDRLVVAATPFLVPLAAALDAAPPALAVFVDTETARLVPLDPAGQGEEVVLATEVPGRHDRGGWAQMAQSRYQRHIQDHRDRHFDAVSQTLVALVDSQGIESIVLAGEPRNLAVFRKTLPPRVAGKIAGVVEGARHEPMSAVVARATELVGHSRFERRMDRVDAVLTEAAKSGQAVAGLEETLEAINRGAVHRLYVDKSFDATGGACDACGALAREPAAACRRCGATTRAVALPQAISDRALATGADVEVIEGHTRLAAVGGVAALLRYPL
jgi:peptide chain release factor subunit 1